MLVLRRFTFAPLLVCDSFYGLLLTVSAVAQDAPTEKKNAMCKGGSEFIFPVEVFWITLVGRGRGTLNFRTTMLCLILMCS